MTDYNAGLVKNQITHTSSVEPSGFKDLNNQSKAEQIELDGRTQFLKLRQNWSTWLIRWISVLLAFQIALTVAVGFGGLDFQKYPWLLPTVLTENFGQIIAMGLVIVRFLYPGDSLAPKRRRNLPEPA
jgi:hypothetical protein